MDGAQLFARYAYPPNALGYCGPEDHGALLEYGAAGVTDAGLAGLARGFDGAWPYLRLIAGENGIEDPLDPRVTEAYWVGSSLLDRVSPAALGTFLEREFRPRTGRRWSLLAQSVPQGAAPHHSFHVFAVYPWVGLLRMGPVDDALRVLQGCRIRWGMVEEVGEESVVVRSQPIAWDGMKLSLGSPVAESVRWASGGRAFVRGLRIGDTVSLHWGWVCDRLEPRQAGALRRYTLRTLSLVNSSPHPAPASVLS